MPSNLSIADVYFFDQLRTSLSRADAEAWLASTCARGASTVSSGRTTPSTCSSGYTSPRIFAAHLAAASCKRIHEDGSDLDFERLARAHGARAGLLFTDAAHELLDSSPTPSTLALTRSTCMRLAPPPTRTDSTSLSPPRARGCSPTKRQAHVEPQRLSSCIEERASMPRLGHKEAICHDQ